MSEALSIRVVMICAAFFSLCAVASDGGSVVLPDHAWVWRANGICGDIPFDGKTVELRQEGDCDWSLNCFRRISVRTGDRFVFGVASESLSSRGGSITASVVTRRADGQVADWNYAPVSVEVGKSGSVDFAVPPGVVSVEPRFTGKGAVFVRLFDISVARLGNVLCSSRPVRSETVRSERLEMSVSADDGDISVSDLLTGRVWRPAAVEGRSAGLVQSLRRTAEGDGIEVSLVNAEDLTVYSAMYRLKGGEIHVELSGSGVMRTHLDYPPGFATRKGDRLILPMNEGIGFPVEESPPGLWREGLYSGHGLCMSFFGVVEDKTGAGWMALVETPDDAAMMARPGQDGLLIAGPSWDPCRGRFGYVRKMRYVFLEAGGHVAMAKRYRAYVKKVGLLVTLAEKAKARPRVADLCGAPNLWMTGGSDAERLQVIQDFRAAGWTNLLWSSGGSSNLVCRLASMKGLLVGRYDIYQDVMDPKHRNELPYWQEDWVTEAFPKDINWAGPSAEQWRHGWPVESKRGPRIDCAVLCDRKALSYARRRIGSELKDRPFNARFIDTTTATPWRECWNPAHPMSRSDSREWKMKLLNVVSGEFGLVCGSETGHDAAVPYCDYFEGMLSLGPYRIDEAGRDMWRVVNDVPEHLEKYQVGETYRLPLWELVYHDCCVAHWYWGDYNNKLPRVWRKRDLFNVLYATPPMYLMHTVQWPTLRERVLESMKTACPAACVTACAEMTDHRFLSADRSVQQSVFSNGVRITVDFARDKVVMSAGGNRLDDTICHK